MRFVALLLIFSAPMALGQDAFDFDPADQPMPVGSDAGWWPAEVVLKFELAEPVGWIELRFDRPRGGAHASGGSIRFRGIEAIEFPSRLLQCLEFPRLGEVSLSTVYIIPDSGEDNWFEEFWTRIKIPYGRYDVDLERGTKTIEEYPQLYIDLLGVEIYRVIFVNEPGDQAVLQPVTEEAGCPAQSGRMLDE